MDLRFRNAMIGDAARVSFLVNSAYRGESGRRGWTTEADLIDGQRTDPEMVAEVIRDPGKRIRLAFDADGSNLLACAQIEIAAAKSVRIGMLTVRPDLQDQGVGRCLLQAAEESAKTELAGQWAELLVLSQRRELIAWYERRGYRQVDGHYAFPYGDVRNGVPRAPDYRFIILRRSLASDPLSGATSAPSAEELVAPEAEII